MLLHAASMAAQFHAPKARIVLVAEWTRLAERELIDLLERRYTVTGGHYAQHDGYRTSISMQADEVHGSLHELVYRIIQPLYALFGFELPRPVVYEEVAKLLRRSSTPPA